MNQPPSQSGWNWTTTTTPAISLRAYIATAALQGMLSSPHVSDQCHMAEQACRYADALLAKLEKEEAK